MKLIIREYFASLRERDELDAILPDLLSEVGFNVISRPSRGTSQAGVDVAAIGPDGEDGGKRKLFLFSIKSGDLDRQDWDGSPQALRPSLNEIQDEYIRSRIPAQYKDLDIVICICMGGNLKETVRSKWSGYTNRHTTDHVTFAEWNGDKLAELLLIGMLRTEILKPEFRSDFQKAVAMVDHPDIAYRFYLKLLRNLLLEETGNISNRLTALRQAYICLWILYVWARDAGNLEAPYRASEVALLHMWHVTKEYISQNSKSAKSICRVFDQMTNLHLKISSELIEGKILPHANSLHALSMAAGSSSPVDVNLALFEVLGRIGFYGLWYRWLAEQQPEEAKDQLIEKSREMLTSGIQAINNNPNLCSPLRDDHAIEIMTFLLLAQACGEMQAVRNWIENVAYRCELALRRNGRYPTIFNDYYDLVYHPKDTSNEYLERATCGSILYPCLAVWLDFFGLAEAKHCMVDTLTKRLPHCTQQAWMPDSDTDSKIWIGSREHGKAVASLPLDGDGAKLAEALDHACSECNELSSISAMTIGFWPLMILACRHYRFPIPPQLWFMFLQQHESEPVQDQQE